MEKKRKSKYYVDINFSDIKIQDFITIAVDNPNNLSPDPDYEPISIRGNEKKKHDKFGFSEKNLRRIKNHFVLPNFCSIFGSKNCR